MMLPSSRAPDQTAWSQFTEYPEEVVARVRKVAEAAAQRGVPIRIGVNSGSLEKSLLRKYKRPTPKAMVASAMKQLRLLEKMDFRDVKISVKASSVTDTIEAYRILARETDCPLHLGVTEAGTSWAGSINSAVGVGVLLSEGLGDTIKWFRSIDLNHYRPPTPNY